MLQWLQLKDLRVACCKNLVLILILLQLPD